METKHTPGPWVKNGIAIQSRDRVVCWMQEPAQYPGDVVDPRQNNEANARLIAAAPDMLPIVELVASLPIADDVADDVPVFGLDGAYVTHGDVRAARAAIAKAKGEWHDHRHSALPRVRRARPARPDASRKPLSGDPDGLL